MTSSAPPAALSGPTAPVPKDPQPSVDRIDDLARRILSGDILLPKFQREFVWERPQILTLWDSIAKGFPMGSILLWQSRQELRSESQIADLPIALPRPDYPVNYLLDGQQRLSSICGAMYWQGPDPTSRWNIAYDLRTRTFLHLEALDDPALHQIRVNKLADPAAYFKHVSALDSSGASDRTQLKQTADEFFRRFKDYKIASVTLGDMDIKDVAPVFERINSQGTPLTIVDLMRAATWSPEFDLVDSIDAILEELAEKNFSNVDRKVVLRNVSAAAGGGFSIESIDSLRKLPAPDLRAAAEKAREAYKRAVDFLATQVGVPNYDILPYSNELTEAVEIFRVLPTPTADQYRAIRHWFWRVAVSGYFAGWNTAAMAEDLRSIHAFAAGTAPEISANVALPDVSVWKSRAFRANNAHSKIFTIVLAHHAPVDLLTGQRIDVASALAWTNQKEFHHLFPREFLRAKKEPSGRINALANVVLLTSASNKTISDKAPSEYLKDVVAAAGSHLDEWLKSNLISRAAFEAAMRDDFDTFLDERAKAIHGAVMAKMT